MLRLQRDPKNEFDGNAIKVFVKPEDSNRHFHVGFLSKSDAALYARAMDLAAVITADAMMLDPLQKYPTIQFELPESAVTKARDLQMKDDFE